MDSEDQKDIIKKVKDGGEKTEVEGGESNDTETNDIPEPQPEETEVSAEVDGEESLEEYQIFEGDNLFIESNKNNMFQPGSNDVLDETKPCWKGYEQIGMKDKNGKQVPNCVPINENHDGESMNYMFWQNLKTIHHASGKLLEMNQQQIDEMCANGHAWAVDHISSSADDMEEVYHFFEGNLNEYDGETEGGYEDEYGSVENVNLTEAKYHGKEVKLGKPSSGDVKKFKVYVKNSKGNVIKVNFGDPNMEIKRDDPERKKSFRARHKCSQAHDRTTPKYWSCKMWSSTPVSKMVAENLVNTKKNSIFVIKTKLKETFNQEDMTTEPQTLPRPTISPDIKEPKPEIMPSRKNKPFLPMPSVQPDPKAIKEGKFDYEIYHKTLSSALDAVRSYAINKGYDEVEFDMNDVQHVPYGHTERFTKELIKGGVPQRKALHVQIYRMESGNYELNVYIN
jgi:hypothetical protein